MKRSKYSRIVVKMSGEILAGSGRVGIDPSVVERVVTFGTEPSPGRGFAGGCWDWLPNSAGVVYVGRDGELWEVDGASSRRLTAHERACRAPTVADGGRIVVNVNAPHKCPMAPLETTFMLNDYLAERGLD